jgi:hypothetical protein
MASAKLGTMQRNALAQLFGRREFSAEDVAQLDYTLVERLPKIGSKGLETIRAWLQAQGLDLANLPGSDGSLADRRLQERLAHATRFLQRHGYRVIPPT